MKKLLLLMLFVPVIGWLVLSDGYCEEGMIYACYQKNQGQMRLVSNVNECRNSELPVYWSRDGYVPAYFKDLYVNINNGVDEEGYGLSENNPFKTISYAIDQVPSLRKSPDFKITIHIAGGNYQENINLDIDNVEFISEPKGGVLISALANDRSVFEVTTASGIVLDGFVINGGYRGLFCLRNSSCKLINCEIKDAVWRGIQVDENSTISLMDCIVSNCGRDGLGVFRSSSATITGDSSEFTNNGEDGVAVGLNSSLIFDSTTVSISNNNQRGIEITGASDVICVNSNISAENNMRDGILAYGGSRFSVWSGSEVYARYNRRFGVAISGSSHGSISSAGILETSENENIGLLVEQSSSFEMDGQVDIFNNKDEGLVIARSSSVQTSAENQLTVKGTRPGQGGYSTGISIGENSTLRSWASGSGFVKVFDNRGGGIESHGILVVRSSNVTFRSDSGANVEISDNDYDGIHITQGSTGRFSSGVSIQNNGNNGLSVNNNSEFFGQGMIITSNAVEDVSADDGSNAFCSDSCVLGEVSLSFGSRGSFFNGTNIATLNCDGTALVRPTPPFNCPSP